MKLSEIHEYDKKITSKIILQSTITFPNYRHKNEETLPTDACRYFYECQYCKTLVRPKDEDCPVYFSYGLFHTTNTE